MTYAAAVGRKCVEKKREDKQVSADNIVPPTSRESILKGCILHWRVGKTQRITDTTQLSVECICKGEFSNPYLILHYVEAYDSYILEIYLTYMSKIAYGEEPRFVLLWAPRHIDSFDCPLISTANYSQIPLTICTRIESRQHTEWLWGTGVMREHAFPRICETIESEVSSYLPSVLVKIVRSYLAVKKF